MATLLRLPRGAIPVSVLYLANSGDQNQAHSFISTITTCEEAEDLKVIGCPQQVRSARVIGDHPKERT